MKDLAESVAADVEIKVVGKSGQLSLGKRFAGKTLRFVSLHPDHDSANQRQVTPAPHLSKNPFSSGSRARASFSPMSIRRFT